MADEGASTRRRDIQGLRAIAVLVVIANHAHLSGFSGGFIGVDVFFVISGFVITSSLMRDRSTTRRRALARFYAHRIARIVPAATLTLIATIVAARIVLGAAFPPTLASDVRWAALFGANLHFMASGANYFVQGLPPSLVTHFWSLSVEEQFYLVIPLVVSLLAFGPRRMRPHALRLFFAAVIVVSLVVAWRLTSSNAVVAYYSPWSRMGELALGGLLALTPTTWWSKHRGWSAVAGALGLAAIGLATITFSTSTPFPSYRFLLPVLGAALILWTGEHQVSHGPTYLLSRDPLVYLGDISYSLYLFHFAWLMIPQMLPTPWTFDGAPTVETLSAIAMAAASYHFVEQPLRRASWLRDDLFSSLLFAACAIAVVWNVTLLVH